MKKQHGFSIIELSLIIVVVAIVGAVGYLGYTNFTKSDDQATVSDKKDTTSQEITSVEDIDKSIETVDSLPVEDSELDALNEATKDL
ncbi:MAG: prepilin-type N-terminal cleavage/methylation domain-containing protein [Candidatus Saccharimonadales bacterium]